MVAVGCSAGCAGAVAGWTARRTGAGRTARGLAVGLLAVRLGPGRTGGWRLLAGLGCRTAGWSRTGVAVRVRGAARLGRRAGGSAAGRRPRARRRGRGRVVRRSRRSSWHDRRPASRRSRASSAVLAARPARGRPAPTSRPARPAGRRRARGRPASWRTARPAGSRRAAGRRHRARPWRRPSSSVGQRDRGEVGVDAERDVGDRADLERDARPRRSGRAARGPRRPGRRGRAGRRGASSRQARTLAGPSSSPPCGTSSSPARSAIAKAGAKSAVRPRRSSLDSPKPTTPRPAYCAASRASVRASSGCRVRLAAMTTAIPRPVSRGGVARPRRGPGR